MKSPAQLFFRERCAGLFLWLKFGLGAYLFTIPFVKKFGCIFHFQAAVEGEKAKKPLCFQPRKCKNPLKSRDFRCIKTEVLIWRRRRDSNSRAREGNLISSQARYDHFDTSPRLYFNTKFGGKIAIQF